MDSRLRGNDKEDRRDPALVLWPLRLTTQVRVASDKKTWGLAMTSGVDGNVRIAVCIGLVWWFFEFFDFW
jgi:hypothetical protein